MPLGVGQNDLGGAMIKKKKRIRIIISYIAYIGMELN
jgi:hypothetical protein